MNNLIEKYINNLNKEDIIKYANKNNLITTQQEIDFIYNFIKKNYKNILKEPNNFDLSLYKDNFSKDNYIFLEKLINKYKRMIL